MGNQKMILPAEDNKKWLTCKEASQIAGFKDSSRIRQLISREQIAAKNLKWHASPDGSGCWLVHLRVAEELRDNPAQVGRPRGGLKDEE